MGKSYWTKLCVWFFLRLLSEIFLSLKRTERDMIINVHWSSYIIPVIPARIYWNLNFLDRLSKNPQISNFVIISPLRAEFCAGGWTDRQTDGRIGTHDESSSIFIVSPCIFVHLVLSPTYALIYIIKILSQAVTLVALFTPTCFDPYGLSSGSTTGPC